MRILRFSVYIFNPIYKEHKKNTSGYGRSVWDICRYSSMNGNEEYLYTFSNKKEIIDGNINIVEGTLKTVLKSFDFQTLYRVLRMIKLVPKFKVESVKVKLAPIKYMISYGYIKSLINEIEPDIIHIHGLTHSTLPFLEAAEEAGIPFIVTLHGLNMNVFKHKVGIDFEIDQISRLNNAGNYITVISSGITKTIINNCQITNQEKIITINHGMDKNNFLFNLNKSILRDKYGLKNEKVILQIGSLSERRNQICLIRSIAMLSDYEKSRIIVYIVGDGKIKSFLQDEINALGLSRTIKLLGYKNHEELSELYTIASLTVVLSKIEGFGRPILESFLFGVPVIAFSDLDAVQDLYKEGCMFLIDNRDENAVCNKIREVLGLKIDVELIKEYASTKTWNAASSKYQEVYRKAISDFNKKNYRLKEEVKHE